MIASSSATADLWDKGLPRRTATGVRLLSVEGAASTTAGTMHTLERQISFRTANDSEAQRTHQNMGDVRGSCWTVWMTGGGGRQASGMYMT